LIIPWQVDVPQDRLPLANWLIIVVIIGFFFWQINQVRTYHTNITKELSRDSAKQSDNNFKIKTDLFDGLVLDGWNARGLLGHMWLHGSWMHLIGNLLFLWIFGNAVCAKIGQIPFAIIYLILGIAAGVSHLLFNGGPAIGASGAINGVVGMYLVFFPTNSISCIFLWILPLYWKTFEVSSYVIILMWLGYDIYGAATGGGHIAYFAHLGGFAAGVVIATILLQTKLVKMSRYEGSIFQIFSEWRAKPQLKKDLFSNRILKRDYLTVDEKQQAEEGKSDTAVEQSVSVSNESSMKAGALANDGFIRFYCTCGKRCKIPAKFAGRTGKCPQCKQPVRIPFA
jgi:membrane associated rhomboid family serine protease